MTDAARDAVVRLDGIRVRRGDRVALDGLTFAIGRGEVVGLLGPNGAGKTTTLSVLATLRRPDEGAAWVAGRRTDREAAAVRRVLGFVPQSLAIYPTLTARENARCMAGLFGIPRGDVARVVDAALDAVGLRDRADDIVATYSGGMQRRLNLVCGLLHDPAVLLLDEPTVGVDPQSRERIFAAVRAQATRGAAVLYSTHYMEEAERLCDRVLLIDRGRIVADGTPGALVRAHARGARIEIVTAAALPAGWCDGVAGARVLAPAGTAPAAPEWRGVATAVTVDALTRGPRVMEAVAAAGGSLLEFHVVQPTLQDVFLDLTGHALRD